MGKWLQCVCVCFFKRPKRTLIVICFGSSPCNSEGGTDIAPTGMTQWGGKRRGGGHNIWTKIPNPAMWGHPKHHKHNRTRIHTGEGDSRLMLVAKRENVPKIIWKNGEGQYSQTYPLFGKTWRGEKEKWIKTHVFITTALKHLGFAKGNRFSYDRLCKAIVLPFFDTEHLIKWSRAYNQNHPLVNHNGWYVNQKFFDKSISMSMTAFGQYSLTIHLSIFFTC